MRKLLFIAIVLLNVYACDDGDVVTSAFDFNNTFQICRNGDGPLVFYKTRENPSESLALVVNDLKFEDLLNVDVVGKTVTKVSKANTITYMTYNNSTLPDNLFCNPVPDIGLDIATSASVTNINATFTCTLTEDDGNDSTAPELKDTSNNGNSNDDTSTASVMAQNHTGHRTYTITLVVSNVDFGSISYDTYNFGTLEYP